MNLDDIKSARIPTRLRYRPAEVPHATVETNRTCNMGCRICYNLDRASTKSLEDIEAEIEALCGKRRLQVLSLLGGEPTLHPDLPKIIAAVKRRGILCQLLTNGRVLLQDRDGSYLDDLARAGVDRVLVHIDSGQAGVYKDFEATRDDIFAKLEAKRIHFSVSVTVYNEDRGRLACLARKYASFRFFDGILAVLAREPVPPHIQDVRLEEEYEGLRRDLGVEPSAFIPSNQGDNDVNWLMYLYFLNPATGEVLAVSPSVHNFVRRAYRIVRGRELFIFILPPVLSRPAFILAAAAECLVHPGRAVRIARMAMRSLGGSPRFQYAAIQDPPEFNAQTGKMRICRLCPDATMRNGRLTPICLADRMNPLPAYGSPTEESRVWSPDVFRHLEGGGNPRAGAEGIIESAGSLSRQNPSGGPRGVRA